MKYHLLIIPLLFLLSCDQNKSSINKLKTENDSLRTKNVMLEMQLNKTLDELKESLQYKRDTVINSEEFLVIDNGSQGIEVIKENQTSNFKTFREVATYKSYRIVQENDIKVFKKYNPKNSFSDFKVEIYQGKLVEPDFSTNPNAKRFIKEITRQCKSGINFAGHYTLVIWGCGSPCQSGVIVDRKTGQIFSGYSSSLGSDFRANSNMIIINDAAIDTATNLVEPCAYCEVSQKVWLGTEFATLD